VQMIGSHFLIPGYRNQLAWDVKVLAELRTFGKWMAIASAVMFLAEQVDRLLLGKFLSLQMLGVYTIAYSMASIPREVIRELSGRVIFPTISKQVDLPRSQLRAKIIRQRWLILLGVAVFLAVLVCVGDGVIMALYQGRNKHWEQYREATWMMPILCTGIWFSVLFYTTSPALLALGKPLYSAQSNFARFMMVGVGLPIAYMQTGVLGAISVISMSDFPLYLMNLYGLKQENLICLSQDIQSTIFFVSVLLICLGVRYSLGFDIPIHALLNPL
jgi:O-antigen/teichoic acid export membrane protein